MDPPSVMLLTGNRHSMNSINAATSNLILNRSAIPNRSATPDRSATPPITRSPQTKATSGHREQWVLRALPTPAPKDLPRHFLSVYAFYYSFGHTLTRPLLLRPQLEDLLRLVRVGELERWSGHYDDIVCDAPTTETIAMML